MVIITIVRGGIFASDINDSVCCLEHFSVPCSKKGAGCICGKKTEHIHGEGFVGVEMAIMGSYQRPIGGLHLQPFRSRRRRSHANERAQSARFHILGMGGAYDVLDIVRTWVSEL